MHQWAIVGLPCIGGTLWHGMGQPCRHLAATRGSFCQCYPCFTTILPWFPTAAGRNFCHWVAHNFPKTENRCLAVPDWPIVLAQRGPLCFVFGAGPTMGAAKPKFADHRAPEPCNAIPVPCLNEQKINAVIFFVQRDMARFALPLIAKPSVLCVHVHTCKSDFKPPIQSLTCWTYGAFEPFPTSLR